MPFCIATGGILIVGPSGSGKTTLLSGVPKHISSELKFHVSGVYVPCSDMVGASHTAVRQQLRNAAQAAHDRAPAVLLLDDIDALFPTTEVYGAFEPMPYCLLGICIHQVFLTSTELLSGWIIKWCTGISSGYLRGSGWMACETFIEWCTASMLERP